MKLKIATLLLCMSILIHADAQRSTDYYFFSDFHSDTRAVNETVVPINTWGEIGFDDMIIESAPVSDGLLILSGLCLIYMALKRKEVLR